MLQQPGRVEEGSIGQLVGQSVLTRISGLMSHPNELAIYMGFIIVLAVSLIFSRVSRPLKLICLTTIGVALVVLANTYSRSSWFVTFLFLALTVGMYAWKTGNQKKVSIYVLGLAIVGTIVLIPFSENISNRLVRDRSTDVRPLLWQVALTTIESAPVLGVGYRNYETTVFENDKTNEGVTTYFPSTPHNHYLLIAAESGIFALLIFLWLNAVMLYEAWYFIKSAVSYLNNMGFSFSAFIFMYLLYSMVQAGYNDYLYVFFSFGMVVAIKRIANEKKKDDNETAHAT